MDTDQIGSAVGGRKVSRRWLLRTTAQVSAGIVAASTVNVAAAETSTPAEPAVAPDHDRATGEIFDRERHHHWDTV